MELNNLDKLADQIYQEGISKAKKDSEAIISKAEERASTILTEARDEADRITKAAQKEANRSKQRAENEIQLAGKQAISQLQDEIRNLLAVQLIEKPVQNALGDKEFVEKLLLGILEKWTPESGINVELAEELDNEIRNYLQKEIPKRVSGIKFGIGKSLQGGFIVESTQEGFYISFTGEDLKAFLADFLSPELQKLLF